jgi:hypothetical protein
LAAPTRREKKSTGAMGSRRSYISSNLEPDQSVEPPGVTQMTRSNFDRRATIIERLLLGLNVHVSWAVQLAVTIITATVVCALWARPISYALKAAALAIGAVLASPHVHGYDVCVLCVAGAFLVKDGLSRGFLARERTILLACWGALILLTGPIPAIVCVVLPVLVIRRAVPRNVNALEAASPIPSCRDRRCERSRCSAWLLPFLCLAASCPLEPSS